MPRVTRQSLSARRGGWCVVMASSLRNVVYVGGVVVGWVRVSYRRGGLGLLVLTDWAIPTALKSGAGNGYRLHVFSFMYLPDILLLNTPDREPSGRKVAHDTYVVPENHEEKPYLVCTRSLCRMRHGSEDHGQVPGHSGAYA